MIRLHTILQSQVRYPSVFPSVFASVQTMQGGISLVGGYLVVTLGEYSFRKGIRDGALYTDKTLTPLGFAGVLDTDWEVIRFTQLT